MPYGVNAFEISDNQEGEAGGANEWKIAGWSFQ
jgi:hypothetical protein